MREILFKAKALKNKQWVIGNLIKFDKDHVFILPLFENASTLTYTQIFSINAVMVDPKTVCQYTGLKDKNGIKIFEYDILEFDAYGIHYIGNVEIFEGNCCIFCDGIAPFLDDCVKKRGAFVVGNIHDKEE